MTYEQVKTDTNWLISNLSARETKYIRNMNRFNNNGRRNESLSDPYALPLSYYVNADEITGVIPSINIVKSVIDTTKSKLSQTRVIPFINSVNGTFKTRKVARNTQIFFDEFYKEHKVYQKGIDATADALIFDIGHLWVRDDQKDIIRLRPWEYFFDRAEMQNGRLSRCAIRILNYPAFLIKDKFRGTLKSSFNNNPHMKGNYVVYYDLINKEKFTLYDGEVVEKISIHYDVAPIATIYYNNPIKGGASTSQLDDIYTIQTEIDMLVHRIHTAATLNPANTIFIPDGQGITPSMISNEIGNVYAYRAAAGAPPISSITPPVIDPQYIQLLEKFENEAYNISGVSQLSAQAKKPSGLNSGVALQTMEDVESERHNVILQNVIQLYMDVALLCVHVFPEDDDIVPAKMGTAKIKWKEIKKEFKNLSIEFGAASALSKDPKVKMEQIEKMKSMGLIQDPAFLASLMDIPDLEKAYSVETASLDVCERIIERAVEDGIFDFYETVNLQQLYNLVSYYINRLDANDEDLDNIQRLVQLLNVIKEKKDLMEQALMPPAPPPLDQPPMPPEGVAPEQLA